MEALKEMPKEKAPGPDGYITLFYLKCWQTIKKDLLEAFNTLHGSDGLFSSASAVHIPFSSLKNLVLASLEIFGP